MLKEQFKYLRLIAQEDLAYFREHLTKFEDEYRTHNEEKKISSILEEFINSLYEDSFSNSDENDVKPSDADKTIITTIFELIRSDKIFMVNPNFLKLLSCVNPDYILVHLKNIKTVLISQSNQWESNFTDFFVPNIYNIYGHCFSIESFYGYISKSNKAILTAIDKF